MTKEEAIKIKERCGREYFMTKEEALKLVSFHEYCTCGGHAMSRNGRLPSNPHSDYCPQKEEYDEWYAAINDDKLVREIYGVR